MQKNPDSVVAAVVYLLRHLHANTTLESVEEKTAAFLDGIREEYKIPVDWERKP